MWVCTKCGYSTEEKLKKCPKCGNEKWKEEKSAAHFRVIKVNKAR
jgi:RNA polymerase subunit RPABC4/transcription elongation factor Spt4